MINRSGLGISVKLLLTVTLLVLLTVVLFAMLNLRALKSAHETATQNERSHLRATLLEHGQTTAMTLVYALPASPTDRPAVELVERTIATLGTREAALQRVVGFDAKRRPTVTCARAAVGEPLQCPPPSAARRSDGDAEIPWSELDAHWRTSAGTATDSPMVSLDESGAGPRIIVAHDVHGSGTPASATDARAPGDNPSMRYLLLIYDRSALADAAARASVGSESPLGGAVLLIVVLGTVMVLLAVIASFIQGTLISKPLAGLLWSAERMAAGDLKHRAAVDGPIEIAALGTRMNQLADGVADQVRSVREQAKQDVSLEMARLVQATLVPSNHPVDCGLFTFAGYFQPAPRCGGGWWTHRTLSDGRVVVIVGDAAHHGMAAVTLAVAARTACESAAAALDSELDVARLLALVNQAVYRSGESGQVMTCFASIIDPAARTITYANAGHDFPYLYRVGEDGQGEFGSLMMRGNRLGELKESRYECKCTQLRPGDTVVWYARGVLRNRDESGEEYGEKRLRASVRKASHLGIGDMRNTVIADAMGFYGKVPREQDISLILGRMS